MIFWFFITVFVLYYVAAAYLGVERAWSFGLLWGVTSAGAYIFIAGVFLLALARHYRIATTT